MVNPCQALLSWMMPIWAVNALEVSMAIKIDPPPAISFDPPLRVF